MKQITLDFDENNTAQTFTANGLYNAAKVTVGAGTFTNVVISDNFNGTVATITDQNRTDLYSNSYGISGVVTVTPSGISAGGSLTVAIQYRDV